MVEGRKVKHGESRAKERMNEGEKKGMGRKRKKERQRGGVRNERKKKKSKTCTIICGVESTWGDL